MDKIVDIRDYEGKKKNITIKNFEQVKSISVTILSGDEVLDVTYEDKHTDSFDASDSRVISYFDVVYDLPLHLIDEFSQFQGDTYDCARHIRKLKGDDKDD